MGGQLRKYPLDIELKTIQNARSYVYNELTQSKDTKD